MAEENCDASAGAYGAARFKLSDRIKLGELGCSGTVGLHTNSSPETKKHSSTEILRPTSPIIPQTARVSTDVHKVPSPYLDSLAGNPILPASATHRSFQHLSFSSALQYSHRPKSRTSLPNSDNNTKSNYALSSFPVFAGSKRAPLLSPCAGKELLKPKQELGVHIPDQTVATKGLDSPDKSLHEEIQAMVPSTPRRGSSVGPQEAVDYDIFNTSSCIKEFLTDDTKMTKEIDSFITRFEMDRSLTHATPVQKEKSDRNTSEIVGKYLETGRGSKKISASDILSVLPISENEQSHCEEQKEEVPSCPQSPELLPAPTGFGPKIIPLDRNVVADTSIISQVTDTLLIKRNVEKDPIVYTPVTENGNCEREEPSCLQSPPIQPHPKSFVPRIIPLDRNEVSCNPTTSTPMTNASINETPVTRRKGKKDAIADTPVTIKGSCEEQESSCPQSPEFQPTPEDFVPKMIPLDRSVVVNTPVTDTSIAVTLVTKTEVENDGIADTPGTRKGSCEKREEEEELSCPQSPVLNPAPALFAPKLIPLESVVDTSVNIKNFVADTTVAKTKTKLTQRRSKRLSKAMISSSSETEPEDVCERLRESTTEIFNVANAAPEQTKRPRGRPRISPPKEPLGVAKVVRKRGRPRKHQVIEMSAEESESKRPIDVVLSVEEKTDVGGGPEGQQLTGGVSQPSESCLEPAEPKRVAKPRQKISKLKSSILRQIKEKQKMYRSDKPASDFCSNNGCDVRIDNAVAVEANLEVRDDRLSVEANKSQHKELDASKKINIVQNILIQAGHGAPVDLMKPHNSFMQTDASSSQVGAARIPKKRGRPKKNCDILSRIMGDMDKAMPQRAPKKPAKPKKAVPQGLEDKQWRKGVLDIAEITHNKDVEVKKQYDLESYCAGKESGILKKGETLPVKMRLLLKKLLETPNEDEIPDHVIREFKKLEVEIIVDTIIYSVAKDTTDKPDTKHYPAPLMTKTQRIFLALMLKLEQEKVENMLDKFLDKAKHYVFKIGCTLKAAIPLTRLIVGVCRLRADIHTMRMFCCDAFFFIGDRAVPVLFTVLTSWIEVIPMEADVKNYPMAKVLVQLVHLKTCNMPGYNLFTLKGLLSQFYGYPKERWDCDAFFEEVSQEYLRNPSPMSEFAIRLFCRNKDTKWVYKKINEFFKPLIYKIPTENVNFKATTILLLGKICRQFRPKDMFDSACLAELNRFFQGLIEDDTPELVKQSVALAIERLPKKRIRISREANKQNGTAAPPNNRVPIVRKNGIAFPLNSIRGFQGNKVRKQVVPKRKWDLKKSLVRKKPKERTTEAVAGQSTTI